MALSPRWYRGRGDRQSTRQRSCRPSTLPPAESTPEAVESTDADHSHDHRPPGRPAPRRTAGERDAAPRMSWPTTWTTCAPTWPSATWSSTTATRVTRSRANWALTGRLRWLHIGGVGMDWSLFPELMESEVVVTNSRGVFDTTLPEYLLDADAGAGQGPAGHGSRPGAARVAAPPAAAAGRRTCGHRRCRVDRPGLGAPAALDGPGGDAGRPPEREGGPGEGRIRAVADLADLLPAADWLIVLAPLTPETRGLIGAAELALLPRGARLVNIGRGPGRRWRPRWSRRCARAHWPGPPSTSSSTSRSRADSPLWDMPNVIVSPHIGGDVAGTPTAFTDAFLANLERYMAGEPLAERRRQAPRLRARRPLARHTSASAAPGVYQAPTRLVRAAHLRAGTSHGTRAGVEPAPPSARPSPPWPSGLSICVVTCSGSRPRRRPGTRSRPRRRSRGPCHREQRAPCEAPASTTHSPPP